MPRCRANARASEWALDSTSLDHKLLRVLPANGLLIKNRLHAATNVAAVGRDGGRRGGAYRHRSLGRAV